MCRVFPPCISNLSQLWVTEPTLISLPNTPFPHQSQPQKEPCQVGGSKICKQPGITWPCMMSNFTQRGFHENQEWEGIWEPHPSGTALPFLVNPWGPSSKIEHQPEEPSGNASPPPQLPCTEHPGPLTNRPGPYVEGHPLTAAK